MTERLQKVLARAGVASRREAERLILGGHVAVDGEVVMALGTKVDPDRQRVTVHGKPVARPVEHVYLLLHKPRGYVSTTRDPQGRPTVLDLAPRGLRVFPVGRLDADSEGLLLLTDDGELTYALTHPSSGVPKEYHVLVSRPVEPAQVERLRRGVRLEDGHPARAEVDLLYRPPPGQWLRVVLREGRNRQIRRMCTAVGLTVARLQRVRLDGLELGALAAGRYRALEPSELIRLRQAAGVVGVEESGRRD